MRLVCDKDLLAVLFGPSKGNCSSLLISIMYSLHIPTLNEEK